MSGENTISPRALLIAVVTALLIGVLVSLAIRPPGGAAVRPVASENGAVFEPQYWRVTSSFTTAMPVIGETPVVLANYVRDITAGAFEIEVFEPGEVVPALEITESVKDRKIQAGFMWVGYDFGRIPASTLLSSVPFGMEPMEFVAWWYHGGGKALGEAVYPEHNVHPVLCAMAGPETAGWFRTPITSLDDLDGMKIRFAGLGGMILRNS